MSIDSILKSHGKNLFDINNVYNPLNTDTYEISDNKLKVYRNRYHVIGVIYHIPLPVGTRYTLYYDIEYGGTATGIYNWVDSKNFSGSLNKVNYTGTVGDTGYLELEFSRMGGNNDKLGWVIYSNIQLELGSTATTYEKYWKGPNVITLSSNSKNLIKYPYYQFDVTDTGLTYSTYPTGEISLSGTPTLSWLDIQVTEEFHLTAGKQYTLSGYLGSLEDVGAISLQVIDVNEGSVAEINKINQTVTFTATDTRYLINISLNKELTLNEILYPQLEEGTSATEYEVNKDKDVEKVIYRSRNLISYPYVATTKTVNGVTFTDNGDGTITANGTATANAYFGLYNNLFSIPNGDYVLSGCPTGGSVSTYFLAATNAEGAAYTKFIQDVGSGKTFSSDNEKWAITVRIISGTTVDNLVFKPQLEFGSTATPYTPYKQEVMWVKPTN